MNTVRGQFLSPTRVVRIVSRLNVGGPAKQAILLSKGLEAEGFETLLVAGTPGPDEGDLGEEARSKGIRLEILPSMRREVRPLRDLRSLASLVSILRRERPAIVHTHTAKAGALGRTAAALCRVPVRLHTFHGHTFQGYFGPVANRANLLAERALARRASRLLAVSERVFDDLVERRIAPPDRIVLLRAGLDLEPFLAVEGTREALTPFRSELGLDGKTPLLVCVGRLARIKRIDVLLRALSLLPSDVHLALVGDGPEREPLYRLASGLGLQPRVHWCGWRRALPGIYASADLVVLSSDSEGLPLSLVEAMACGRATVATEVGGVPELLVHERTGLLVPPREPESLARAIGTLLGQRAVRAEMGARGRARVRERYAASRLLRETAALYRSLLSERAAGG
ncbi:MAG TPA: glycosyltransferase family 4 protein [Planctomycetota bacterium]|nr:glycosyltransferase family 4 protein [Planctomycetota bacterium]